MLNNIQLCDNIELHELIEMKLIRQGKKYSKKHKYARETRLGDSQTKSDNSWKNFLRDINREDNKYDEVIYEKGTIINEDHTTLTNHFGHGSARPKKIKK